MSNLCLIINLKNPIWFYAISLIDVKGLIRISQLTLYLEAICQAGPEPIDLPKIIKFYYFQLPNLIKKFITYYESLNIFLSLHYY